MRYFLIALLASCLPAFAADAPDLIVHHGKIVTVDAKFSIAQALAVKDGEVVARRRRRRNPRHERPRHRSSSTSAARRSCPA